MKHARPALIRWLFSAWMMLLLFGGAGVALAETPEEQVTTRRDDPAWLSRTQTPESQTGAYRSSALRSLGAMLLIVGLLLAANHYIRKRFLPPVPVTGPQVKVLSRLRLGPRQEVVVVEWEGEQMVLGVGPTFIQPLHTRRGGSDPSFRDTLLQETDRAH